MSIYQSNSPVRSMTSLATDCGPSLQDQIWIPTWEEGKPHIQFEASWLPHELTPLLRLWAHFTWQVSTVSRWVQQQIRTIFTFLPSVACITLSVTVKASQERGFQVSPSLISLYPATKICGVFDNRVLPSSYGGQPRIRARTCVASVLCIEANTKLVGGCPRLTQRSSFKNPYLTRASLFTSVWSFLSNSSLKWYILISLQGSDFPEIFFTYLFSFG